MKWSFSVSVDGNWIRKRLAKELASNTQIAITETLHLM
jgi:hypothetical protein